MTDFVRERLEDLEDRAAIYVSEINHLLRIMERIKLLGRPSGWPSDLWAQIERPALRGFGDVAARRSDNPTFTKDPS